MHIVHLSFSSFNSHLTPHPTNLTGHTSQHTTHTSALTPHTSRFTPYTSSQAGRESSQPKKEIQPARQVKSSQRFQPMFKIPSFFCRADEDRHSWGCRQLNSRHFNYAKHFCACNDHRGESRIFYCTKPYYFKSNSAQ